MLGISASELFAHVVVGCGPEAAEVAGELDGAEARREQLDEHGAASAVDTRCVGEAEAVGEACAEHRVGTAGAVVDAHDSATRELEMRGRQAVHPGHNLIADKAFYHLAQVNFSQFLGCRGVTGIEGQP